jgi:hypothetical protein
MVVRRIGLSRRPFLKATTATVAASALGFLPGVARAAEYHRKEH